MNDQYITNVLLKINAKVNYYDNNIFCLVLCCLLLMFNLHVSILIFLILSAPVQLGGMNSLLTVEHSPSIPLVSKSPTLILGMDVSHGSPGRSDVPSIAAVTFYYYVWTSLETLLCSPYSLGVFCYIMLCVVFDRE